MTTLGNYFSVHSGLYRFPAADPTQVIQVKSTSDEFAHVSASCQLGDEIYCVGTGDDEFDYYAAHSYYVWSVEGNRATHYPIRLSGNPYGIQVLKDDLSLSFLMVGDAGDYFNPGTVSCYRLDHNSNEMLWSVTAGVCPGHFALY